MRKIQALIGALFAIIAVFVSGIGLCDEKPNLYNTFKGKPVVKVFVADINNATDSKLVDVADFKDKLETALSERKSINFKVVNDRQQADIIIDATVIKFLWSAEDPLDMAISSVTMIGDALIVQNYAYTEVIFAVTDAKKNRVLWKEKLKVELTKEDMPENESVPLINAKVVKIFIRDCFSK